MSSSAWEGQATTMQDIPVNVTVIAQTPEEMAGLLYALQKRVAALESIVRAHLAKSRQACLLEVGFLEEMLRTEPTTKELRDKAYNETKRGDLTTT